VPRHACSPARRSPAGLVAGTILCLLLSSALRPAHAQVSPSAREIELQYRTGGTQLALQRAELAAAAKPGDASLRFLLGVLLSESGRTAEAVVVFERMTEDFPDQPEPYNNLAVIEAAKGQLDRARSLLDTALRLDPAYRTAHENLGDVYVRLAHRAYQTAASGTTAEPLLKAKLRLARELAATH
jgi:Flp pilus assembly protein TadD